MAEVGYREGMKDSPLSVPAEVMTFRVSDCRPLRNQTRTIIGPSWFKVREVMMADLKAEPYHLKIKRIA
jgi:hypothetical protein